MNHRITAMVVLTAAWIGWSAAAYAGNRDDLNNCRNSRHPDSISACDKVIVACRDFEKPATFIATACPLYVYTNHTNGDIGFALAGTYVDRANAYLGKKDFDKALADLDRAVFRNSPYSHTAYLTRGRILYSKGRYADAVENFTTAIATPAVEPTLIPMFHVQRASAYVQLDKLDLAREDLDRSIKVKPFPGAYLVRANLSTREGKFDQAHADVTAVLQLQPRDVNALNVRGTIFRLQKQWDDALADFNKSIELQPITNSAFFGRAQLHLDQGDLDLALADLNIVLESPQKSSITYLERGLTYLAKGNRDAAKIDFTTALTYPPLRGDRGNTHDLAKAALAKI